MSYTSLSRYCAFAGALCGVKHERDFMLSWLLGGKESYQWFARDGTVVRNWCTGVRQLDWPEQKVRDGFVQYIAGVSSSSFPYS